MQKYADLVLDRIINGRKLFVHLPLDFPLYAMVFLLNVPVLS